MQLCPGAEPGTVPGDANGDGHRDLTDVVFLREHVTAGGPAPWCTEAIDLVPDGLVELDDAFSLLIAENEGAFGLPARADLECDGAPTPPAGACRPVSLAIDPGAGRSGPTVRLVAPDAAVQGWQLGVSVEGCRVTGATTAGTAGAPADPELDRSSSAAAPGARRTGYDGTFFGPDGATSTVLLSLHTNVTLETGADGVPILALEVEPRGPGDGCVPCTLTVGEPTAVLGGRLDTVIVADGARYAPHPVRREIEACPAR